MILKKLLFFITIFIFGFLFFVNTSQAQDNHLPSDEEVLEGKVVKVVEEKSQVEEGITYNYQRLQVKITKGSLKESTIELENGGELISGNQKFAVGDKVVISYSKDFNGEDFFLITDYVRRDGIFYLFVVFIVLVVAVGQIWGFTSLMGMAFSFLVIFTFVLPQIISGMDAILAAILGAVAIIPVTFTLSHGFKKKTIVAIVGTIITLIITGVLAAIFVELTKLSGFSAEEAGFLQFQLGSDVNMKGILLAGMIISSLGILDDVTISQSSVVSELLSVNKNLKVKELFTRAMKVGRDHIASLVNTLILVYTGASLPLLLLFINNPRPFDEIINYEVVAEEIVKTMVGSIGLILAVPITTALAVYYYKRSSKK